MRFGRRSEATTGRRPQNRLGAILTNLSGRTINSRSMLETSGFTFPHRIEYMDGDGRSLAVETIDEFDRVVAAIELGQEVVAH